MRKTSYLQRFGDIELAVRRLGEGIPFTWGHSLMGSMRAEDATELWDWKLVEDVAQVVRYDARGHGNSDGSYDPEDYRWEHMASDMLAVARSAAADGGWTRSVLGGISMGCATALEAAVQRPDEVAGLVLALPPTAWETRPRQAAIYRRLSWISGLFGAAPYRLLDRLPVPVRDDGRSRLAINTARGLALANPLQVQAALRGAALSDMPDPAVLRRLRIPALILAWIDDTAHPVSTAEALADLLPGALEPVICDPADTSEWLPAMLDFVEEVSAKEKKKTRRRKGRARAA